jgi:hypothetical protein
LGQYLTRRATTFSPLPDSCAPARARAAALAQREAARAAQAQAAAAQRLADDQRRQAERAARDIQRTFSGMFQGVFASGAHWFQSLWDTIRQGFVKLIADMLAARLTQRLGPAVLGLMGLAGGALGQGLPAGTPIPTGVPGLSVPVAGRTLPPWAMQGAGGLAGFALGYGSGNAGVGILGGAGAGAAVAGPAGAIVGAVGGLVGGLLGHAQKARDAARQMQAAEDQFQSAMAGFIGAANGQTLPAQIAQVRQQGDALIAQAQARRLAQDFISRFQGRGPASNAEERAIFEAEQRRIQQLQQEAALLRQTTSESLAARQLAATGHQREADALNLQIQQAEEYQKAVEAGWTAQQLATLKQVQGLERVKAAADDLSSSFLNLSTGFRVTSDWFHALSPQSAVTAPPTGGAPGGAVGGTSGGGAMTINVLLDGKVVAQSTVRQLQRKAGQQFGDSTKWSQVQ